MSTRDAVRPRLLTRLLLASRPLSWVNTAYPFGAAYLLAGGGVDALFVIGCLFFLVPYNLAMYGINDVFDYASDAVNPRKGGEEGALVPPALHRRVLGVAIGLCVPFVVALVLLGPVASWPVLAVSLFAVAAYSAPRLRFKEVPVLDSITSSTHFVSPAVFGMVAAGAAWNAEAVIALVAFFYGAWQVTPSGRCKMWFRIARAASARLRPCSGQPARCASRWCCGAWPGCSCCCCRSRRNCSRSWRFPI